MRKTLFLITGAEAEIGDASTLPAPTPVPALLNLFYYIKMTRYKNG